MQKTTLIGLIALTAGFCFGACPQYDVTGDCWVGVEDLAAIASEWMTGSREPVPYVLDMTQAEAVSLIVEAGLTVEVNFQYSEAIASGYVISQEPSGDEFLAAGDPVCIVVSWGWNDLIPPDITWLWIVDSGAGMIDKDGEPIDEGGFTGFMSKYETTNAQYCKYLNKALLLGYIEVSGDGDYVTRIFSIQHYYHLAGLGYTFNGAINGGAARINYNSLSNEFTVDSGFEHHPVSHVTWDGAAAFADSYDWRLPTEWEWQAVADYDGSYEWGCGPVIHNGMANYRGSYHPVGTITVGTLGTYGYGLCDMAGNVDEWTSSERLPGIYFARDGNWQYLSSQCCVYERSYSVQSFSNCGLGFRVVMD